MSLSKKIILTFFIFSFLLFSFFGPVFAQEAELEPAVKGEIPQIVARIIKFILGIVGVLALIMFIYGGIVWMTSAGNIEQVKKGKNTLVWAALGLAIVFFAYSLVYYILEKIIGVGK